MLILCVPRLAGAQEPEGPEATPSPEPGVVQTPVGPAQSIEPAVVQTPVGPVPAAAEELDLDLELEASQLAVVTRLEAQMLLSDRIDQEEYIEAVPLAARLVELSQEEFGPEAKETAVATANLAELQRRAGLFEDAEPTFLTAIDLFRDSEGEFTESVIVPLVGLGAAYHEMGEYPQALTVFQEARTGNRRVHGLLNADQIQIMDHIANTLVSMDQYLEADEQKVAAMRIMERLHGAETLEMLPAIYRYARWLRRSFRFYEERDQYGRAMDIIENLEGEGSPLLVRPLSEIANSYRVQKLPEGRGIGSLRAALEILEAQTDPDKLEMAEVLRDNGDGSVAFSKVGATGVEYLQAWELLNDVEDGEQIQQRWFSEPSYVLRENPSTRGLAAESEPDAQPGNVLVTFDVTPQGRTININILESVPPGLKDDSSARAIARSRFRPRIVDGEIVAAEGIARNFTFHFVLEPEE